MQRVVLGAVVLLTLSGGAAPPETHRVAMRGMQFVPARLVVRPGDRVTWTNEDIVPHSVTSATFDSGSIADDASWSYVAKRAGEFPYRCTFHPSMKALLIVR